MKQLRFHPLNLRMEAAAVLERLAYRGDNERCGDMRATIDFYCKKYNLERDRFSGILGAYEHVKANFVCEEHELLSLFGIPEGLEANLCDLLYQLHYNLGDERVGDLNLRIALILSEESDASLFGSADAADLLAYVQRMPISDQEKLTFADAIIRYDDYAARAGSLLDQAEALLREKADLLEPFTRHALEGWNALPNKAAFFDLLAANGLRLDSPNADVYPMAMQFTTISVHSNILSATHLGTQERTLIRYGVFVDAFTRMDQSGKTDLETIANLLHALDDKKRLQILVALRTGPLYGQELAGLTELSPATVSHHMSELAGCGLVTIEKQGVKLLYHLNGARIQEFTAKVKKNLLP